MEIKLWKRPKGPIIIEGFPGFGLVGTIASEFLVDHLKTEQIGKIIFEDMPAMVAIHENKVVEPLGIFYDKKYNVVILHAITNSTGYEWEIANTLVKLVKELDAKEVISLEGVGSSATVEGKTEAFYYTDDRKKVAKFAALGVKPLKEGIIMGVTGALLLKTDQIKISAIFSETHSNLPDSKAAAEVIKVLDKYLGLKVDYKPLLEQAQKFEEKVKGILSKTAEAEEISEKKKMSYVG